MLQDTRQGGWEKGSEAFAGLGWEKLVARARAVTACGLVSPGVAHRALLLARLGSEGAASSGSGGSSGSKRDGAGSSHTAVSGEELAAILGVSRAAVHKHVEGLRDLGVEIGSGKGTGYYLRSSWDDLLAPEAVLPYLLALQDPDTGPLIGLPYHYLRECCSTNEVLKQAAARAPSGAAVVTDRQTAGRGRLERSWFSQSGKDLTFSVILRPRLLPAQAPLLSLAAALAVAEVLEQALDLRGVVKVKWPNDVLLAGKKVCGILLEGSLDTDRLQWAIVGVGLNVNSDPGLFGRGPGEEVRSEWQGKPEPISLQAYLSRPVPRAPLLAALLTRLGERCGPRGEEALASGTFLEEVRARDALAGQAVAVPGQGITEAKVMGIGREGQLLVKCASGEVVPVVAGDVVVRPRGLRGDCQPEPASG